MNTSTSLKGSKFYGEFHAADKKPGLFLYKLATGKFVVVEKAEYSGKVLSVSNPIEVKVNVNAIRDPFGKRMWMLYEFRNYDKPIGLLNDTEMHVLLAEIEAQWKATGAEYSNAVGTWVREEQ